MEKDFDNFKNYFRLSDISGFELIFQTLILECTIMESLETVMKIYFSIIFAVFFLYRRLCVHLLLMKCEKRNGDEISSTLEFFSGCAPSGQIAVEDKGGGVIASFETVRRKFRLNRNEKRSDFHLQRRFISLIVHFSREWNEKRFVIGHCVPMLRGLLFRDEGKKRTRIETSPVFESLNCKIRSFLGLWNARLAILYSNDFIR